ncbi:SDR family NAD(P)-dependent oxidoreductase [Sinimarinibacterium flocculans]|uniref:SDR family NAD(P)-dependent oxidoreductase n=1 Tax=Sinimarinibacterium flocculans TaxID=985250 RepID=UPI002491ADE4|nr:SDR family oxidoreductase [Sinimarinibacterium flocculans]
MILDRCCCLVTGANSGIGLAIVRELAKRPVRILGGCLQVPAVPPEVKLHAGSSLQWVPLDLGSRSSIDAGCEALGETLAEIDVLISNAGVMDGNLLDLQPIASLYETSQINLTAPMHLTARLLPNLLRRGRGKLIYNTSFTAYAHVPGAAAYSASKAGMQGFCNALRRELSGTGITVLSVVTPAVRTDMLRSASAANQVDLPDWTVITPESWATQIVRAIERDTKEVWSAGLGRVMRFLAHQVPWLFNFLLDRAYPFRRNLFTGNSKA